MNKKLLDKRYIYSQNSSTDNKEKLNYIFHREFEEKFPKKDFWKKLDCFICDTRNFEIFNEVDRYGFYYPTGICNNCGNIQQTEYLTDNALKVFYDKYFRKIYQYRTPQELFKFQKYNRSNDIFYFTNTIFKSKKILDVGCGTGGVLSAYLENGCDVLGLDFDDEYLAVAKLNGINVRKGSVEKLNIDENFDLIIVSHVLEHVLNPYDFLVKISKHLSENGMLYIEVPSLDYILKGAYEYDLKNYFHNTHITHFSIESLKLLCQKLGLKMVKKNEIIQSCWIKSSIKCTIESDDKKNTLINNKKLLEKIEKNRKSFLTKIRLIIFKSRVKAVRILEFFNLKSKIKSIFRFKNTHEL